MEQSLHNPSKRRRGLSLMGLVLALALFAAACGSDDPIAEAAAQVDAIETNDGGVRVKPPDVLDGDTEDDLPPLVEGARLTPIVDFEYFDGTPASTAEFRGRPTVLNFWASTCAACIAEMPEFEEVHLELADSVDFVGVNTGDIGRDAAVRLAGETGVTYPLADDQSSALFREFGGFVMPTTVLLNPQGQVAFTWSGVLTGDELTRLINEHILVSE